MNEKKYPRVIREEKAHLFSKAEEVGRVVELVFAEAERMLKKHPDSAHDKVMSVRAMIRGLEKDVTDFKGRIAAFEEARTSHPRFIAETQDVVDKIASWFAMLREAGYRVVPDEELKEARAELACARQVLEKKEDVPCYDQVVAHAKEAKNRGLKAQSSWDQLLKLREENDKEVKSLERWHREILPALRTRYEQHLASLKAIAPEEVWGPVAQTAQNRTEELHVAQEKILSDVRRLNSMDVQNFTGAVLLLGGLRTLRQQVEESYRHPEAVYRYVVAAQEKAGRLLQEASEKVERARRATRDSDAEGAGKNNLRDAEAKLLQAQNFARSSLPDWITVAMALASVISLAELAERAAKSRANEVYRRRQSRHSSSWSSGTSSRGSSGSGFGGFSGGGFGGGGASGGW